MGTFHSIFARILRAETNYIGYSSDYTIYDADDSRSLIKDIIKELNLKDDKAYKPSAVAAKISRAKNALIQAKEYPRRVELVERDKRDGMHAVAHIYEIYQERLRKANAMDFDDLLLNTYLLLKNNPEVREKYENIFLYVLVDEYQDTNYAQQQILWLLTQRNQVVCVVGDDAQSIYGFRGAEIDNILTFNKLYNGAETYKLEQNYRSTQNIVEAANSLIRHNSRQIPKNVFSEKKGGDKLKLRLTASDREEACVVCNDIERLVKKEHRKWSDCAILYRTNAQSRTFEEEMVKRGIPYRIFGGTNFYQRKEVKDVLAYFRLICNPHDEEAFKRVVNYPQRGIGATTLQKIIDCAVQKESSLWEVVSNPDLYGLRLSAATWSKIEGFCNLINGFRQEQGDATAIAQSVLRKTGIYELLSTSSDIQDKARAENLDELLAAVSQFVQERVEDEREEETTLRDYMQTVSLLSDLDSDNSDGDNDDRALLMTIHSAKGLEFPVVFIVGLEESIFPSQLCLESPRELEEERRLLYVAITRAKEQCLLSCAQCRFRYGKMEFLDPSRFLREIDRKLMDVVHATSGKQPFRDTRDYGFGSFGSDRHPGFGPRVQNQHPVGFQFMADKKEKITTGSFNDPSGTYGAPWEGYPSRRKPTVSEQLQKEYGDRLKEKPLREKMKEKGFKTMGAATLTPASQETKTKIGELHDGSVIRHQRFGIGTVTKIEGSGENTKATVEFADAGSKQLLLKFAKFEIIK